MSLFKKFTTVGIATFSSRCLGLAREIMMAAMLAAGPIADIFYTCFRLPNLFRAFFAEGAFNIAFVPLYAKTLAKNKQAAKTFSSEIFAVLATWLIVLTLFAILTMPFIVANILAPGFADTPNKLNLSITMTKIMFPYLLFMSLSAMFAAILNCLQRYFIAAFAPIFLNVVLILVLTISFYFNIENENLGIFLSIGVLTAGVLQMTILFFAIKKQNMTFALAPPRLTPKVKKLLQLMLPALLTGGILQINLLIGTIIATSQDGANALLNYADRINQLPLGIIGIAVGVVLLPELTKALQANKTKANELQNRAIEFSFMLALPACFALLIMPNEIIALIYQRGQFTATTTLQTAEILFFFAIGLPAFILIKTLQPAFFARQNMKTPFFLALIMVAINISISLSLFPSLGPIAIALATSIAAWLHLMLTIFALAKNNIFIPSILCLKRMAIITISAVFMGFMLYYSLQFFQNWLENALFFNRLLTIITLIILAKITYFASLWILQDKDFIKQIKFLSKK